MGTSLIVSADMSKWTDAHCTRNNGRTHYENPDKVCKTIKQFF